MASETWRDAALRRDVEAQANSVSEITRAIRPSYYLVLVAGSTGGFGVAEAVFASGHVVSMSVAFLVSAACFWLGGRSLAKAIANGAMASVEVRAADRLRTGQASETEF